MNILLLVSGAMLLLLSVLNIYNYSVPLGENDTIMMYYDEPISEKRWQEMEEADERTDRGERNDRGDRAGRR